MGRCPLHPHAERLVFVARDLFGTTEAAPAHHDQQRLRHLCGRGLQPIHRRPLCFPEVRLATATVIALPASMAPIAHHMGLPTVRIWTRGQTHLLFSLWFFHEPPPPLSSITPASRHYQVLPLHSFL